MAPMKLRTISRVIVVALVVVVGAAIVLHSRLSSSAGTLSAGTVFSQPAPAFQLADQTGNTVSLARLRGSVVVLTFLDADCANECSATTQALDSIAQLLGTQARGVVWLALSVNPNNTPAEARRFVSTHSLTVPLHLLLGTQAALQPLWRAYGVDVVAAPTGPTYTAATYVIDQRGNERELLRQPIDAAATAQDLRILLAGGA